MNSHCVRVRAQHSGPCSNAYSSRPIFCEDAQAGSPAAVSPHACGDFARRQPGWRSHRPQSSIKVPTLPDFSERLKWAQESETLGFPLSVHPLELAEPFFRSLRQSIVPASVGKKSSVLSPAAACGDFASRQPGRRSHRLSPRSSVLDMAAHVGKKIYMKGWPVTRKEVLTREGEEMEFFTFEDKTGIFETVFFPKPFRRFCQDLDMSHAYLLHGQVESEFDVVSLNVDYAYRVPKSREP
jgi:DNA polymerase III alpha subunit